MKNKSKMTLNANIHSTLVDILAATCYASFLLGLSPTLSPLTVLAAVFCCAFTQETQSAS